MYYMQHRTQTAKPNVIHTLFLYTITKNRKFRLIKEVENGEPELKDISEYLQDIFDSYYTEFIINFGDKDLIESLGD